VVAGTDQLRQRVATAYSEIWVISSNEGTINGNTPGEATWYDMLADDAFVNFRQLMYELHASPVMGEYLNMRGTTGRRFLTERELRPRDHAVVHGRPVHAPADGTLMLDTNGQPIPTYASRKSRTWPMYSRLEHELFGSLIIRFRHRLLPHAAGHRAIQQRLSEANDSDIQCPLSVGQDIT